MKFWNKPSGQALAIVCLILLFGLDGWLPLYNSLFLLIAEPSLSHLRELVTGRPFLLLVIIYLAALCVFLTARVARLEK